MNVMSDRLIAYSPQALGLLRIVIGLLFLEAGVYHVFGWPVLDYPPPPPEMETILLVAGWLELVGGVLIIAGFLTRPTAFVLAGMMAVAYWGFHAPSSFWPVANMGVPAILYSFIFLYMVFAGPGAWSADGAVKSSRG
jgi:putative oxidoreductase